MPIYAYRCETCGFQQDVLQKMSDARLTVCPSCGNPTLQKQVTAAGFQLKGSGWYVTDFRNPVAKPGSKPGDAAADSKADGADAAPAAEGKADAPATGAPAAVPAVAPETKPAPVPAKTPPASSPT